MADIKSLSDQRDGIDVKPKESLRAALIELEGDDGAVTGSIVILARLDGTFHWNRRIAGMRTIEAIALLEAVKHDLLRRA